MSGPLEFRCGACGEVHRGLPAWHFQAPLPALAIPEAEWETRVELTGDDCVIDGATFFLKGLLEVPVHGVSEPLTWGVWLSVSDESYRRFVQSFDDPTRPAGASYFGWLCNSVPGYPETQLLKTRLHLREYPTRPWVELEPSDHPLAVDQRDGVTRERAVAIAEGLLHPRGA